MNQKLLSACLLFTCCGLLSSCLNDDEDTFDVKEQFEKEQTAIDEYIAENNLDVETDSLFDLRYIITNEGTGTSAKDTSAITVTYTGTVLGSDIVFDDGDSVTFKQLGGLIPGWRILLSKINVGGKMTMFIPSYYAYGDRHINDTLVANSTLIFEVELHRVEALFNAEQRMIDEYLEDKNLTAEIDTVESLRYIIHEQGTGDYPTKTSRINVDYVGKSLDKEGKTFDSGNDVNLDLKRLIKGWPVLMPYVREGGKITLFLPSKFAYGRSGAGTEIQPHETLIFEVTLNEVLSE